MAFVVVQVVYSAVSNSQPEWPLWLFMLFTQQFPSQLEWPVWLFMLFTQQFPTVSQNGLCGCSCCLLSSFQLSARIVMKNLSESQWYQTPEKNLHINIKENLVTFQSAYTCSQSFRDPLSHFSVLQRQTESFSGVVNVSVIVT